MSGATLAYTGQRPLHNAAAGSRVAIRVYGPVSLEVDGGDVGVALTNNDDTAADPASPQWKVLPDLAAGKVHKLCYEANYLRLEAKAAGVIVIVGVPGAPGLVS